MSAGPSSRFSPVPHSPSSGTGSESPTSASPACESAAPSCADAIPRESRWVPSRFNVRAVAGDGRLVLWNTFQGSMSVFPAAQRDAIEGLLSKRGFVSRREGMVAYLLDRGFLLEAGTDEIRRTEAAVGRQQDRGDLLELFLLASEDCNFRCKYCYEAFARGTMEPWVRAGVRRLVARRLPTLRSLNVGWFGGEPLFGRAAIEELAPYFLATAKEHGLTYFSHMTTNGYLLTPEVADKLLGWKINEFQITVDGPAECHDRSRPTHDGRGTFRTIYENLRALSRRSDTFRVNLRVNFDRGNHPRLRRFLDRVERDLGDDPRFRLRFHAVGKWGGANGEDPDVCGVDEGRRMAEELRREALARGLRLSGGLREIRSFGSEVCYAARPYNFVIGAGGKVMKCTVDLDLEDRNVVGRLTEEGELDLDEDKLALWTEAAYRRDPKCPRCVLLPSCQGMHCPRTRMETGRSPCTPLRTGAKTALLEALAGAGAGDRRMEVRRVPLQSRHFGSAAEMDRGGDARRIR